MKEIKFRAWDTNHKCFYHWFLRDFEILQKINNEMTDCMGSNIIEMQFTGLKDKNGKDIYEGDILNCQWNIDKNIPGDIVEYIIDTKGNCDVACFALVDANGNYRNMWNYNTKHILQVVGNIYENPELLEAKE